MAKLHTVSFNDDINNEVIAEGTPTVSFGIDGKAYEIDLTAENQALLRDALAPFVAAARKAGGRHLASVPAAARAVRAGRDPEGPAKREWLRANGFPSLGARGKFSADHDAAWNAYKAGQAPDATDTPAETPEAVTEDVSTPEGGVTVRTRVKKLTASNIAALISTGVAVETGGTFAIINGTPEEALAKVQDAMNAEADKRAGNYPSLVAVRNKLAKMEDKFIVAEAV